MSICFSNTPLVLSKISHERLTNTFFWEHIWVYHWRTRILRCLSIFYELFCGKTVKYEDFHALKTTSSTTCREKDQRSYWPQIGCEADTAVSEKISGLFPALAKYIKKVCKSWKAPELNPKSISSNLINPSLLVVLLRLANLRTVIFYIQIIPSESTSVCQ